VISFNRVMPLMLCALLTACSSPPKPPLPDRSSKQEVVNSTMPLWEPNNVFISSASTEGNWQIKLANFQGDNDSYPPAFWYALLHSRHILVATGSNTNWFAIKGWLRSHGARQVIEYRHKPGCFNCADIYFAR